MAGRGQIPNPALRRHDDLCVQPAVYLIEAGDMVKVGRGQSALSRLRELHTALVRRGLSPGRFDVFYTEDYMDAETRCIHALMAAAPQIGREYFANITFDEARAIVRTAIGSRAMKRTTVYIRSATGITHGEFLACEIPA